jgi:hypothetical protein
MCKHHKGIVRGAINKAVQCRSDSEYQARKEAVVANNNNKESSKSEVTYEMQREVRQVDEERRELKRRPIMHSLTMRC